MDLRTELGQPRLKAQPSQTRDLPKVTNDSPSNPLPAISEAPAPIPGNPGIWVGIFCILAEFLLLFCVYFITRAHHLNDFAIGPDRLATSAGVAITLCLLTSGYAMVKAVHAIRLDQVSQALHWVLLAILLGGGYPLIKFFEIQRNLALGLDENASAFYLAYYYLTLNHLVHVFWGLLGLVWVAARTAMKAYSKDNHAGLEAAALYWHTTDIIWLVIFPFFYVLR